jgi:putative transposase
VRHPSLLAAFLYDVEELLTTRGSVMHETIRQWYLKIGQQYAEQLRRHHARSNNPWVLDEMFLPGWHIEDPE